MLYFVKTSGIQKTWKPHWKTFDPQTVDIVIHHNTSRGTSEVDRYRMEIEKATLKPEQDKKDEEIEEVEEDK